MHREQTFCIYCDKSATIIAIALLTVESALYAQSTSAVWWK